MSGGRSRRRFGAIAFTAAASATVLGLGAAPASAAAGAPTCSTTLGITVHGQHVVTDYVMGSGHVGSVWPVAPGEVGAMVGANRGAALPGGPGPAFHFANGIAPGASFCNGSSSPGLHL